MYILIDGMPGTGKTSICKQLAKKTEGVYMKSVISDTKFGNQVKQLRSDGLFYELDLLLLTDLTMDELRVGRFIEKGNLIRDKSFCASLGHHIAQGYASDNPNIEFTLKEGYCYLSELIYQPDIAVHLKIDELQIRNHFKNKTDISEIDKLLLENTDLYQKQDQAISQTMQEIFKERYFDLTCFCGTVDEMADMILEQVNRL